MFSKFKHFIVFASLIGLITNIFSFSPIQSLAQTDFETKVSDIFKMEKYRTQNGKIDKPDIEKTVKPTTEESISLLKKKKVTFDKKAAIRDGFALDSVVLNEELTEYTNELIDSYIVSLEGKESIAVDVNKHKNIVDFYNKPNEKNKAGGFKLDTTKTSQLPKNEINVEALEVISEQEGAATCGYYGNLKPSSGKNWDVFYYNKNTQSEAQQILYNWGYHATPQSAGGSYTRAITWNYYPCGDGTFRDQGQVWRGTSGKWHASEQNYSGWLPRGEPNPEVWTNWHWPYTIWPSYVSYWHANVN